MRLAAAAILALLLLAAPARAATVTGGSHEEGGGKGPFVDVFDLAVQGDPGEASDLTVTAAPGGGHVDVTDTTAPLVAKGNGRQVGPSAVACDGPSAFGRFTADLGDANDRLAIAAPPNTFGATIAAGPGDDEITGGPFGDAITGGGGHDVLHGGGGDDSLSDNDTPGAADSDVLDRGPGTDSVSYRGTDLIFADLRLTAAGRRLVHLGSHVTVTPRGGDATGGVHVAHRTLRVRRG